MPKLDGRGTSPRRPTLLQLGKQGGQENASRIIQARLRGTGKALSRGPDGSTVAIAGKDVFSIQRITNEEASTEVQIKGQATVREAYDLRANSKLPLGFAAQDVAWGSGTNRERLVTACSNGGLVTWNLGKSSNDKVENTVQGHSRTVNRVHFNSLNPNWMISAGQDGSVKLWDLRQPLNPRLSLSVHGDPIRDIEFNPANLFHLVSGTESGSVEFWDLRRAQAGPLAKFTAHRASVHSVNWQGNGRWLATGSGDHTVKVWDMNVQLRSDLQSHGIIHTTASVSKVSWRQGGSNRGELAICPMASLAYEESSVQIWDLRRPHLPKQILCGAPSAVTDFVWHTSDLVWCAFRDQTFAQLDTEYHFKPISLLSTGSSSCSPDGSTSFVIGPSSDDVIPFDEEGARVITDPSFSSNQVAGHIGPDLDPSNFEYLATHYSYDTKDVVETCRHNGFVTEARGLHSETQIWKFIETVVRHALAKVGELNSDKEMLSVAERTASISIGSEISSSNWSPSQLCSDLSDASNVQSSQSYAGLQRPDEDQVVDASLPTEIHVEQINNVNATNVKSAAEVRVSDSVSWKHRSSPSKSKSPRLRLGMEQRSERSSRETGNAETASFHSSSDTDASEASDNCTEMARGRGGHQDGAHSSDVRTAPQKSSIVKSHASDQQSKSLPRAGRRVNVEGLHMETDDRYSGGEGFSADLSNLNQDSSAQKRVLAPVSGPADGINLRTDFDRCFEMQWRDLQANQIKNIVEGQIEQGNLQIAITIQLVVQNIFNLWSEKHLKKEISAYLGLLHQKRLFDIHAKIIKWNYLESVQAKSRALTKVSLSCPHCLVELEGNEHVETHHCPHRQRFNSLCSICHRPVRGLWSACLECGHGGCLHCWRSWWHPLRADDQPKFDPSGQQECPTGCGHICYSQMKQ